METIIRQSNIGYITFYLLVYLLVIIFFTSLFYLSKENLAEQVGGPHPEKEWIAYSIMMTILSIPVIIFVIILNIHHKPLIKFTNSELIIKSPSKKTYKKLKEGKRLDRETRMMISIQKFHNNVEYYLIQNKGKIEIPYKEIYEITFSKNYLTPIFRIGILTIFSSKGLINIPSIKKTEIELIAKSIGIKYIEK
ncbi:hypothetical protein COU53_03005 [Candidatus Pacearchaeota archaeon CG10_big_fil_rev_8_21_14_0_10_30_48]|nr:MAG: hypothetical protein COU53_03005 [Candidatus Pacearchaeota archaeon CG10_big_fil_rev_8_21_14_0_10_30_48]